MYCYCDTNNGVLQWTLMVSLKAEVKSGVSEEWASPVWLAISALNVAMH